MAFPYQDLLIESILACLTNGVITIDASDRITLWNDAAQSILRLDSSTALGQRYQDVFSSRPQLGFIGALHVARLQYAPGALVRTSVAGIIPERGQVNLNLCIRLLADTSQAYSGMVVVIDDRTDIGSRR